MLVRLNDEEWNHVKSKIEESKLSQAIYLRFCALANPIYVLDYQAFFVELKRIGNNLNQLTYAVHLGKFESKDELIKLQEEVKELWQLLRLLKGEKASNKQLTISTKKGTF